MQTPYGQSNVPDWFDQKPIILDDTPSQGNKVGSTFTAYGINLQNDDIETSTEGKMMNDNIVTVLFRQVFNCVTESDIKSNTAS